MEHWRARKCRGLDSEVAQRAVSVVAAELELLRSLLYHKHASKRYNRNRYVSLAIVNEALNMTRSEPRFWPAKEIYSLAFAALITLLLPTAINSAHAAVYVYERPDGSKLITDKKSHKAGYKLKKSYRTSPYRSSSRSRSRSPYFAKAVKSQYDALIVNTALKYDLEPSFIKAVIHVESAFDRHALSHAGAMGLMQIMPATAANYELRQNQFDASRNIEVGVKHMKELMDRYSNDKKLSLAAYNAGAGAVSRYNGVPPYEETENYIVKVMKLYGIYKKEI